MVYLGKYYRTYAMDFWGFGESGKKRETYAVQDFVDLVDQFMDQLGISEAPLVGHSMGEAAAAKGDIVIVTSDNGSYMYHLRKGEKGHVDDPSVQSIYYGPTLLAGLSKHVELKLVDRQEFGSGAVVLRYESTR